MQEPQQVTTTTITTTNTQQSDPGLLASRKRTLRGLGITECILSGLCFLLAGIAMTQRYVSNADNPYALFLGITIGEGMWLSILPFIAGILAIVAGGSGSNPCMLRAHMALAIISTLGAFILICMEIAYNMFSFTATGFFKALLAIITILALTNFIILIVSASYTCMILPGGCSGGSDQPQQTVTTQQQSPAMYVQYANNPGGQQQYAPQPGAEKAGPPAYQPHPV